MRFSLTLLFVLCTLSAFSQWTILPILRKENARTGKINPTPLKKTSYKVARLDSIIGPNGDSIISPTSDSIPYLKPILLPFWDDFSSSNNPDYPDTSKWRYGKAVDWNFGVGINPPTLGVVSFNGLDSLGSPYDVTNQLAKGYGDRLTSWTFNLDTIPLNLRDSVYLSFYFEYQGNGEPPDPGDHLQVEFRRQKNKADTTVNRWISVGAVNVDSTIERQYHDQTDSLLRTASTFYPINIKIDSSYYFHDQFQFRISSFGRISGPWDTWIVDYVYLNIHRYQNDVSFPDRTISTPLTSLLGNYWSVPAPHFHADSTAKISAPKFIISNLAQNQTGNSGQPITYSTSVTIDEWKDSAQIFTKHLVLDTAGNPGKAVDANEYRTVQLATIPSVSDFTKDSDSIRISLKAAINSGDDIPFDPFTGKEIIRRNSNRWISV